MRSIDQVFGFARDASGWSYRSTLSATHDFDDAHEAGYALGAAAYNPSCGRVYFGNARYAGIQVHLAPLAGFYYTAFGAPLTCGNPRGMAYCPSDRRMYAVGDAGAPEIAVIS